MRLRLRDALRLVRTSTGRVRLASGLRQAARPIFDHLAKRRRRKTLAQTRVTVVVGSFGKTTTARAVTAALGFPVSEAIEFNTGTAPARALLHLPRRARHAVLEIGIDGPGQMRGRAEMVRPDIVVVTGVGSEHGRSLGDLEATRREKAEMVRFLSPSGVAVLNGDDPNVRWMAGQTPGRVVLFGTSADADVRAQDIVVDFPTGTSFTLIVDGARREMQTKLLGRKAVLHVLAAIAVGLTEGKDLDGMLERLKAVPAARKRLEPVLLEDGTVLLRDEFKSAVETIHAALDLLEEIHGRRKVVVLGEVSEPPGSQGPIYRAIGGRVAQAADAVVHVGHDLQRYTTGLRRAGMDRAAIHDAGGDLMRAVEIVRGIQRPGDVILIKGRDTQRLDRVALALMGRQVRCMVSFCNLKLGPCDTCSYLSRGWPDNIVRM